MSSTRMMKMLKLRRTPLLVEWEEEERLWQKARKRLKQRVNKVHKRVEKKVNRRLSRGPRDTESDEDFAHRMLDKQDTIRDKMFAKHAGKIRKLERSEQKARQDYERAEQQRPRTPVPNVTPMIRPRPTRPAKMVRPRRLRSSSRLEMP